MFIYTHASFGTWSPCYTLLHGDNTLRPSSLAIANLAWHIEDKGLERHAAGRDGTVWHVYTNARERVSIVYAGGAAPARTTALPRGWVARDLFGNTAALPLRLGGAPVYLTAPASDTRPPETLLAP